MQSLLGHTSPRPLVPHVPTSSPSTSSTSSSTSSSRWPPLLQPTRSLAAAAQRTSSSNVAARALNNNSAGSGGGGADRPGSSSNGGRSKPERKARKPGLFEIKVVTPPPRSLGVYALPPLTHNGEEIEIDGHGYVVTSLVLRYKLHKGKYVRDHSRLEVQPTGRYFLNMMLDNLIHGTYMGPTDSKQD